MSGDATYFRFRTSRFRIDPAERPDAGGNRYFYGKELALWLKERFAALGYEPTGPHLEQWGWSILLRPRPFNLAIGCHNASQPAPEIEWSCHVAASPVLFTAFFWKWLFGRANMAREIALAERQLEAVLRSDTAFKPVRDHAPRQDQQTAA